MSENEKQRVPRSRSRLAFQERKQEQKKRAQAAAVIGLFAAALCIGFYVYKAQGFSDTYLPHTVVNGIEVSGKTAEEVKSLIGQGVKEYRLELALRGGEKETLTGEEIGLHTVFDGSLEEIIHQQNPYAWPRYLLKGPDYDIRTMIDYDGEMLRERIKNLSCMDGETAVPPADAYLSDYIQGQGYVIVPEEEGNTLNEELVEQAVVRGVKDLSATVDLEQEGCYLEPAVRSEDEGLRAARDARNHYVNAVITYIFGSSREVLDGSRIHQWLITEGGQVSLDDSRISEYVKELAAKYNTAYKKRSFQTSYGQSVEVSGVYGWRIDQAEEAKALKAALEAGESSEREPVYAQKAASHDGNDYGTTYAEVNLTAQHLFFYKDGEKILESDFVSGNVSRGHTTPPGLFSLTYKQRDAVLRGEGYAAPVKFWMPFNGGIGFHDASWRSSFGGSIYKTSGSHGCINMPYEAAKTLFEHVYAGMPVICYNLSGTESGKASQASGKASAGTGAGKTSQSGAQPASSVPQPAAPQGGQAAQPTAPAAQPAVPEGGQQVQPAAPVVQPAGSGGQTGASGTQPGAAEGGQAAGLGVTGAAQGSQQVEPAKPEETQPSSQPSEGSGGQASGVLTPGVTIAPVDNSKASNGPGSYGPAFQNSGPTEKAGPGVP